MGCYDTILFHCPNCGEKYRGAQSKSGGCILREYPMAEVPEDVAIDANRHAPFTCDKCGKKWQFSNAPSGIEPRTVELRLEEID